MYGRKAPTTNQQAASNKNPNRVLGGLRGQGADMMTVLGEDGSEHIIPSTKYVQGLEEKLKTAEARITTIEKQVRRISRD